MKKEQISRKYNFTITENISFSLSADRLNLKGRNLWQFLFRVSNGLALSLLALLFFTTLWNTFYLDSDVTASANMYAWTTIIVALGFILLWQILMTGIKRLADPPGFIGVLGFALISIIVWIIAPESGITETARTFNTFGVAYTKEIAGLGVIAFVGIYYFLNQFIDSSRKLKWALGWFYMLLAAAALMLLAIGSNFNELPLLIANAVFVLVSWSLAFYYRPQGKFFGKFSYLALFIISSAFFLIVDNATVWRILVMMIVACILWFVIRLLIQNFELSLGFNEWRGEVRRILNRQEPVEKLFKFPMLNLIFLILWLLLLLVMWSLAYQPDFSTDLNSLFSYVGTLLSSYDSFQTTVLGLGSSASSFPFTFFYKILAYQGLLGAIAYIGLAFTMVFVSIRQIFRDRELKVNISLAEILTPAIIFILLLGLMLNLNTTVVLLIWIMFSLVTASGYMHVRAKVSLIEIKKRKRVFAVARVLAIIVLFILWAMINNNLLGLFNDGII